MRRGSSLPLALEVVRQPGSPSSVGSCESQSERRTFSCPEEKRARCLFKSALKSFEDNENAKSLRFLEQSIGLYSLKEAEELRDIVIRSIRNGNNNQICMDGVTQSCPTGFMSGMRSSEPRSLLDRMPPISSDVQFEIGSCSNSAIGRRQGCSHRSFDSQLLRSSSSSSDGIFSQKPPKVVRRQRLQNQQRGAGGNRKKFSTSPTIGQMLPKLKIDMNESNPDRKRLRRSNDTFHFGSLTLEDTNSSSDLKTRDRTSLDSTASLWSFPSSSEIDLDFEQTSMYSPSNAGRSLPCDLPIASHSPERLPSMRSDLLRTPGQFRSTHGESMLLSEEKRYSSPQSSRRGSTFRGSPGSNVPGIERPQMSESPILNRSIGKSRSRLESIGFSPDVAMTSVFDIDDRDARYLPQSLYAKSVNLFQVQEDNEVLFEQDENDNNASNTRYSQKRTQLEMTPCFKQQMARAPFATPTREEVLTACAGEDVSEYVRACKSDRIKIVAIDFDQTFVSIHTNGNWRGTVEDLEKAIRPVFRSFIPALLSNGIIVAIATFSPQTELIKTLVQRAFPDRIRVGENFFICGENESRLNCVRDPFGSGGLVEALQLDVKECPSPTNSGKRSHISSICNQYFVSSGRNVKVCDVLLIDDDEDNVRLAHKQNIKAIQFLADESFLRAEDQLLRDIRSRRWAGGPPRTPV